MSFLKCKFCHLYQAPVTCSAPKLLCMCANYMTEHPVQQVIISYEQPLELLADSFFLHILGLKRDVSPVNAKAMLPLWYLTRALKLNLFACSIVVFLFFLFWFKSQLLVSNWIREKLQPIRLSLE